MQNNQKMANKLFFSVSIIGTVFVLAEMLLQFSGKSLCAAVGCKMVAQHARFGDGSILLMGLLLFSALSMFSFLSTYRSKPAFEKYVNFVLIVSLACEGFFTGYQAFRLYTPCLFCLAIFGLLLALSLLRLISGAKEIIAGYAAMAAIFSLFYLVLPAESTVRIPEHEQLVLFYSKGCNYCAEVMTSIEASKMPVDHVLVGEYAGLLKSLGIEHVPALYVNKSNEKIFLIGKDSIERYLFPRAQDGQTDKKTDKTGYQRRETARTAEKRKATATMNFLNTVDNAFTISPPSPPEGACKKDEDCN